MRSEPFWLKLKHCIARACDESQRVAFFPFCSSIRHCEMPLREWSRFETPSGWYTMVRAHHQKFGPSSRVGCGNVRSGPTSQQVGTRPPSQRFHDVGIVEASSVHQLRQKFMQPQSTCLSAIEALGVGSEEAKGLEEALVRAKP